MPAAIAGKGLSQELNKIENKIRPCLFANLHMRILVCNALRSYTTTVSSKLRCRSHPYFCNTPAKVSVLTC